MKKFIIAAVLLFSLSLSACGLKDVAAVAYIIQVERIKDSEEIEDLRKLAATVKTEEDRAALKSALDETMAELGDAVEYYSYDEELEGCSILIVFKGGYNYVISVGVPEEGLL